MPDDPQIPTDPKPHFPPTLSYATPRDTAKPYANAYAIAAICLAILPLVLIVGLGLMHAGSPNSGTYATLALLPILGALLGIAGRLRARNRRYRGRVLSIWAICLGSLQVVWLFLLLSKSSGSEQSHDRHICANNLRLIAQALQIYATDNAGRFPPTLDLLITANADIAPGVFLCPNSKQTPAPGPTPQQQAANFRANPKYCSYTYLPTTQPASSLPDDQVLAYEPLTNHDDGINALYADGHVDWLDRSSAQHLLSELSTGHNPPRP